MSAPLDYEGTVTLDTASKTWRGHIAIATHLYTGYLVAEGFLKYATHAALVGCVTSAEWQESPDGKRRLYEFSGALFDGAEAGTYELGMELKVVHRAGADVPHAWAQALLLGSGR